MAKASSGIPVWIEEFSFLVIIRQLGDEKAVAAASSGE